MNAELKYKVISLLQQPDLTAHMISEELDLTYGSVLRVEKEFKQAKLNGTLNELLDSDEAVLASVAANLDIDQASLTKGLEGLDRLNVDLQVTASQLNTRVRSLIMSVDHLSDLKVAAEIICQLNTAFVNPNKTQVNVQNNFGEQNAQSSRYAGYLSDKPVD